MLAVGYGARFEDSTEENFEWLIDINFWGVVHGTRAFLPLLKQSKRGHLVNLSSIFGMVGIPTQSAYNAAKFAVRGFSEVAPSGVPALEPICDRAFIPAACRPTLRDPRAPTAQAAWPMPMSGISSFRRLAKTTPERAADIILRGAARGKRRIMVGWDAWLILQLTKILPTRYHWITARVIDD